MSFHVGQRVVCIAAHERPGRCWGPTEAPTQGAVYTVRKVRAGGESGFVLWFDEIARDDKAIAYYGPLAGYGGWRFRPIVERKTDIAIFTKIIDDVRYKAPAKVE